jgi:hypothetical protein
MRDSTEMLRRLAQLCLGPCFGFVRTCKVVNVALLRLFLTLFLFLFLQSCLRRSASDDIMRLDYWAPAGLLHSQQIVQNHDQVKSNVVWRWCVVCARWNTPDEHLSLHLRIAEGWEWCGCAPNFVCKALISRLQPATESQACSLLYCSIHNVQDSSKGHYWIRSSSHSLLARKRKLRRDDLAALGLYPLDGLLSLVVDHPLLLEVLNL